MSFLLGRSILKTRVCSASFRTFASRTDSMKHLQKALQGRDVVFYTAPDGVKRTFTFMYISAGVQLLFWGNLASLAYVSYAKKESDEEDAPVVLAPQGQRAAIAAALVAVGVGISSLMCIYPFRYIDKITLLRGSNIARLTTHARFFRSHMVKEYPIDKLACKQTVFTGIGRSGVEPLGKTTNSHIFLRADGQRMAFMLDRKGKFMDSKLFDALWHKV